MAFKLNWTRDVSKFSEKQDLLHYFRTDPNEAEVIVVNHIDRNTVKSRMTADKIMSIAFTSDDSKDLTGLCLIKCSIHPTMADILNIASLTAPLHIYIASIIRIIGHLICAICVAVMRDMIEKIRRIPRQVRRMPEM